MTGPEHYTAAEDLIRRTEKNPEEVEWVAQTLGRAQVHATLALAAATAQAGLPRTSDAEWFSWIEAAGLADD